MLDIKEFDKNRNYENFKNKYIKKINNYFSEKLTNFVNKNFIYYYKDNEYLNRKNILQKIEYDLKKLNYTIIYKSQENMEFKNEEFNSHMQFLESSEVLEEVESLYEKDFDIEIRNFLNLKKKHFENINNDKNEVLEEYLCWEIYRYFFCEYLVKKICNDV